MIERDIYHFGDQTEECSGECFDFDRLSPFCLRGLMLKREQREAVSRSREDFPSCGFNTNVYF